MSQDVWFAFCERSRALSLDDLSQHLAKAPSLAVRRDANVLIVAVRDSVSQTTADVSVTINQADQATIEAAELASQLRSGRLTVDEGVPPPNPDALARADCRYELESDLRVTYETYNGRVTIAGVLEQECGAIVYDATNRRFV